MEKVGKVFAFLLALSLGAFGVSSDAMAMHIMEGYLPLGHCLAWAVLSLPFLIWGVLRINKLAAEHRKTLLLLAMAGAYVFVLSALKIPSVTGSSSHPTGVGLGAILFGPAPMAVLGGIALLFQAVLLAHGGLTTLGANIFSMAVAGPFLTFAVYRLCLFSRGRRSVAIFLGAALGALFTYTVTSLQLGFAYPAESGGVWASTLKFMGIFSLTQVPLAVIEGLLTVAVVLGLESYAGPELNELGYFNRKRLERA